MVDLLHKSGEPLRDIGHLAKVTVDIVLHRDGELGPPVVVTVLCPVEEEVGYFEYFLYIHENSLFNIPTQFN